MSIDPSKQKKKQKKESIVKKKKKFEILFQILLAGKWCHDGNPIDTIINFAN